MLVNASDYQAVIAGLHFVGGQPGHEMYGCLHTLVFDLFVLVDEVARRADRSRNTGICGSLITRLATNFDARECEGTNAEEVRDPTKLPQSWKLPSAIN